MQHLEIILFWLTVFTYAIAFGSSVIGFAISKNKALSTGITILWLGLVSHTALIASRWVAGGHMPVTDTYELNMIGTWFTVLIFLFFEKAKKLDRSIGLIITPIVFLILGHGFLQRSTAVPMGPAYNSLWLIIHVIFAWLSFGSYAISTGAAILLLSNKRFAAKKPTLKIPDPQQLDTLSYRFIILGFINHVVMLVSGAIWAKKLWGHYWSWDALETLSLVAFLFYAFYLHARSFLDWKMARAAWLAVFGLVVMAVSFWGASWFSPSIHPGP